MMMMMMMMFSPWTQSKKVAPTTADPAACKKLFDQTAATIEELRAKNQA